MPLAGVTSSPLFAKAAAGSFLALPRQKQNRKKKPVWSPRGGILPNPPVPRKTRPSGRRPLFGGPRLQRGGWKARFSKPVTRSRPSDFPSRPEEHPTRLGVGQLFFVVFFLSLIGPPCHPALPTPNLEFFYPLFVPVRPAHLPLTCLSPPPPRIASGPPPPPPPRGPPTVFPPSGPPVPPWASFFFDGRGPAGMRRPPAVKTPCGNLAWGRHPTRRGCAPKLFVAPGGGFFPPSQKKKGGGLVWKTHSPPPTKFFFVVGFALGFPPPTIPFSAIRNEQNFFLRRLALWALPAPHGFFCPRGFFELGGRRPVVPTATLFLGPRRKRFLVDPKPRVIRVVPFYSRPNPGPSGPRRLLRSDPFVVFPRGPTQNTTLHRYSLLNGSGHQQRPHPTAP